MGLRAYIIRRMILAVPTLIGVTLLIFAVLQFFTPSQRAALFISDPKGFARIDDIIKTYHLDAPLYEQYYFWISGVLAGNLGWSKTVNMPVSRAIRQFWPPSLEIALCSAPVIVISGIYLGVKSALHKDKAIDHMTRSASIIGWSLPSFWIGIILLAVFYGHFGLVSAGRLGSEANAAVHTAGFVRYTGLNTVDAVLNGQLWIFTDAISHLVLPVISLTIQIVALIVRIMRSSMLEALSQGYILAVRAKGLKKSDVINKHARRNALIPVVTVTGMLLAGLLNGVVITETVFSYRGLGWFAANAASSLDIAAVLAFALIAGVLFVVFNLVVDVLYAYIDPRVTLT